VRRTTIENLRLGSLVDHFALLPDPRIDRTKRHLLLDIVVITVCAVLCGADTWVDLAEYGRGKYEWLKRFLPVTHRIPSHDTFARVFARLNSDAFRTCFLAWLEGVREQTGGQLAGQCMAVDGKTSRHSFDRAIGRSPWHVVSAWATETGLVLGQVAVEEKSNEITAIPELLTELELAGCIVTIDAMGTQKEIAKTLVELEADDVLALKGNQGTLYADVELFFQWANEQQYRGIAHVTHETQTTGHGRVERRRTTVTDTIGWLQGRKDWVGLQTIVMIEAWRTQGHETSYDRCYYLSSLGPTAKKIGESVQGPWTIENSLHWVLDIAFRADDSCIRQGNAPEHFAMLRHIAVNLLKQERTNKYGVKAKRNRAGWDNDYLLTVLGI
jgi:predicted transposase YbfD/YdcC